MARRIGLFGGSFDPPHVGHVALLKAALEVLHLDGALVIPTGLPVHRRLSGCATPAQRLAWMRRIFDGWPGVDVLDWEVREERPTPSIATLRRFVGAYPDCHPVLLLGADAFAGMDGWVEYPDHAALCDVAVFGRVACTPGEGVTAFLCETLDGWLRQPVSPGRRVDVDAGLPDISATAVRRLATQGESLRGKVPECVRHDIEQAYADAKPMAE